MNFFMVSIPTDYISSIMGNKQREMLNGIGDFSSQDEQTARKKHPPVSPQFSCFWLVIDSALCDGVPGQRSGRPKEALS